MLFTDMADKKKLKHDQMCNKNSVFDLLFFNLLSSVPFLSSYNLGFLEHYGLASIGNIIPGLIASWMDRQGSFKTVSVIIIIAVLTRLIMIIISGGTLYV